MTKMSSLPNLTPAQIERLAYLSEELAEAQHCVGKILRHGWDNFDPTMTYRKTNRELLHSELGDVLAAVALLHRSRDLDLRRIERCKDGKLELIDAGGGYFHHAADF